MTANESKIYGALLILASLMVIALVVMGAPAREKVKCEGYNLDFVIEGNRDTFRIGDPISIANATNNVNSLEWLVSDLDSVLVGEDMSQQSLVLVFTREGEKNIQLRINDRKDCTTVAKRIFIMPHCSDGLQNGSETEVDCGGNCPPCPTPGSSGSDNLPSELPKSTCYDGRQNGAETGVDCGGNCSQRCSVVEGTFPQAYIVHVAGELKCNEYITFDCGIPDSYRPFWTFDDLRTKELSGKRVTHKITHSGTYIVRVYIGNTQVGQKQFNIGVCSEASSSPPPTTTPTTTSIILPSSLSCKEALRFYSTNTQIGSRLRWQLNGIEKTGENFYHTFEQAGIYTLKLYVGSNNNPADTRTFTINCDKTPPKPQPIPTPVPSDISSYLILKNRLQDITDESAKTFRVVTRNGPKYQRLLGDPDLCKGGKTIVSINNENEKSLDAYFEQIIKKQYIINQVRVKKNGNCIEKILINHHKK